jgi:hypothetical protein
METNDDISPELAQRWEALEALRDIAQHAAANGQDADVLLYELVSALQASRDPEDQRERRTA